jgi:hypothetical protein
VGSTDFRIERAGLKKREAEGGERERLTGAFAHGDTHRRDDAIGPGSGIEVGDEMKNEQTLRELLRACRGGVRSSDEDSSALQMSDEGAERGEMVAPRAEGRKKDLYRAFLRGGQRSKVLRKEREEGERTLLNIHAGEKILKHIIANKANEERGEELAEGALSGRIRRRRLKERNESSACFSAIGLEAKTPTGKLGGGEREGESTHRLTLFRFGRRFRSLRRTAG